MLIKIENGNIKPKDSYFLPLFANFFPFAFKKNSGFFIFMSQLGNPNNKDISDIPELAPPAMTRNYFEVLVKKLGKDHLMRL